MSVLQQYVNVLGILIYSNKLHYQLVLVNNSGYICFVHMLKIS